MAGEVKTNTLGVGAHKPGEVTPDDDIYEQYKKRMMLGYRYRPNPLVLPFISLTVIPSSSPCLRWWYYFLKISCLCYTSLMRSHVRSTLQGNPRKAYYWGVRSLIHLDLPLWLENLWATLNRHWKLGPFFFPGMYFPLFFSVTVMFQYLLPSILVVQISHNWVI